MKQTIIQNMGIDRIRARVPAWHAALRAGHAAAARCNFITKSGKPCRRIPLRGSPSRRCACHLKGAERDAHDLVLERRARHRLRSTNTIRRAQGIASLQYIERRRLHRLWKRVDPNIPGTTLELAAHDEKRVLDWLLTNHGIDLDTYRHDTGHRLSARAVDRLRWGAVMTLSKRITAEGGRRRVVAALRDDRGWWRKHSEL